ncbi:MAG TPA: hypothetical protein VFQ61_23535 [Polyangiaceae bacterium]|nr:hypothetical protein [Polyangiaceae bacterium]
MRTPPSSEGNTCEFRVGRLMEIRVPNGYRTADDVDRMVARMTSLSLSLARSEKFIIAADWRKVSVLAPEVAEGVQKMLALSNARVIRSSILILPERSLTDLQVHRLVREADNPNRKYFTHPQHQYAWLSEVLTAPEKERLAQFLEIEAEPPASVKA